MLDRSTKLKRNFNLMFWIQALTSVQVMNAISTIFMVHRGLTLAQIFYTAIIFSLTNFVFEVPSSYMADRWGRKNVVILSNVMLLLYWISSIFAHSFPQFMLAISLYACSFAMLSGTDEALIYDTAQELGHKEQSLKQLGVYFSAQRMFKIVVPLVAVLIAKNLSEAQFVIILMIDVIATSAAFLISFLLIEPTHHYSVEKNETGIIKDALKLFRSNHSLFRIMMSKTMIFIAAFILWRVFSDFFLMLGMPIIIIGLLSVTYQSLGFTFSWNIAKIFPKVPIFKRINFLNRLCALSLVVFFTNSITVQNLTIYIISFVTAMASETIRSPLYSQLINSISQSYNRATMLSLANALKSILDIPLLFLSALFVSLNYSTLFGLIVVIALIPITLFEIEDQASKPSISS